MAKCDELEHEIELLEKEIRKYEQLGLTSDKYYMLLQVERCAKFGELEFCRENNL